MKTTKIFFLISIAVMIYACTGGGEEEKRSYKDYARDVPKKEKSDVDKSIEAGKGVGEVKEVPLTDEIDQSMADKGKSIYEMKCASCHKLTDQRVVGPGFQGVTNRRRPEWIMNMITNVDVMLAKDPTAQKLLEQCLTRMPNQNVSVGDARDILEFFRRNDLKKTGEKDGAIES